MDPFTKSYSMILAISFAIQQLVELFDSVFYLTEEQRKSLSRPLVLKLISIALGFGAALTCSECEVIVASIENKALQVIILGFGFAGGTEGANSILKFAKYSKDNIRAIAAAAAMNADNQFVLHGQRTTSKKEELIP